MKKIIMIILMAISMQSCYVVEELLYGPDYGYQYNRPSYRIYDPPRQVCDFRGYCWME